MGKRLSKSALLQEIEREWRVLDGFLERLTPRQMTQAKVTAGGWSVKDILGHLVGWQQMNLIWYAAGQSGEKPPLPAPGFGWKDIRKLNAAIYRRFQRRSLQSVLGDFESHHRKMLGLIQDANARDFARVGAYEWTGPTWTLSDYVRANTASHYRWASKHIRKWLGAQ